MGGTMSRVMCDFCGAADPGWEFPAENFRCLESGDGSAAESDGNWLACDACCAHICANDYELLARRSLRNPSMAAMRDLLGPEGVEYILEHARLFHAQFARHRTGEPVRRGAL